MIGTVVYIAFLRLWNNKQELVLVFAVPMLFFSIFALIFEGGVGNGFAAVDIAVIDEDQSQLTKEIVRLLKEQSALKIDIAARRANEVQSLTELTRSIFRNSSTDVVIHLPKGFDANLHSRSAVTVQLFVEGTNPVGRQIVRAMLAQAVALASASRGPHQGPADQIGMQATTAVPEISRLPPTDHTLVADQSSSGAKVRIPTELVSYEATDVFAADKHNPKIAMYAAGIAVMFLLFSATGAGGSLLEEYEAGTLDRLLTSQLSMTQLLAGKWLYITCLGCVQLTVMFVWAQLAFGVDLWGHISGFSVMTLATAAATASFALCLAVLCRTRAQLNGVSIVVILSMSALGGSMVPRYIMSEEMQQWGQLTFNAWALDGFKKVFWHDLSVTSLGIEVKVLLAMAVALAGLARLMADRWASK